jgi:NADPH-dependent curcumin reductase CurA
MIATNRQVLLKSRPSGIPQAENFEIVATPVPEPADGEVLVRNLYLSVEPAMRGWVSAVANYSEPVAIGAVMRSLATGRVVASGDAGYQAGDLVTGWLGWQEYACVRSQAIQRKLPASGLPISTSLGVLGLNGLTAYFGLLDIGRPKAGQTVVVSTAAGAVGSCVGQIAKIKGCRAVGIAGGPIKAKLCTEVFGYDVAIDYKAGDLDRALSAACPDGVDIYFDNTAGTISDAVLEHLAVGARIIICGTASVASWSPAPQGPRVERHLLVKRASMQGLLVMDHEGPTRSKNSRDGSAPTGFGTAKTSWRASSRHPGPSPGFTAARTSASGSSGSKRRVPEALRLPVDRRWSSVCAVHTGAGTIVGGAPRCMPESRRISSPVTVRAASSNQMTASATSSAVHARRRGVERS